MGEQIGIRDVPEPTGIIGHGVERARNIMMAGVVAVCALEERIKAEEVGAGGGSSRSPFGCPGEGGPVVAMDPERTLMHVATVSNDSLVCHGGGQFQVGDGNGTVTMCRSDQGSADGVGEGGGARQWEAHRE